MHEINVSNYKQSITLTISTIFGQGRWLAGAFLIAILAFFLLGLTGCGEEAADLTTDTGGKVEIVETYYDFGSVAVGEEVKHSFTIKNTGDGPLHLGEADVKRLEGC